MSELTREQVEYAVGRLVRLVEFRGITQTQLEQRSGVNQSTISKILSPCTENSGERYTPSEDTLKRLFSALGLKLTDIISDSDRIAEEIVGYLATPLTGLDEGADREVRRIVNLIRTAATHEKFQLPPFDIYWPGDHTHPRQHADIPPSQVYVTDRSRASTYDFINVLCDAPSNRVGQEN